MSSFARRLSAPDRSVQVPRSTHDKQHRPPQVEPVRRGDDLSRNLLERIAVDIRRLRTAAEVPGRGVPERLLLTPTDYVRDLRADEGFEFLGVLIDNPSLVPVHYGFSPGDGTLNRRAGVVPPLSSRMIQASYELLSVGITPTEARSSGHEVFVTRLERAPAPWLAPLDPYSTRDAPISTAAAGDTTLVAAPDDGRQIVVVSYVAVAAGAVTVLLKAGANQTGAMSFAAAGGNAIAGSKRDPILVGDVNSALVVTLGGAVQVSGHLSYYLA